jgi:hypothetical protein
MIVFKKAHYMVMSFFIMGRERDLVNKLILANVANQYACGGQIDCMLFNKAKAVI